MKLGIISAVWGREALTTVWWHAIGRVQTAFHAAGVTAKCFVAGSEAGHQALAKQFGGVWVHAENDRVGEKWNAAYRQAIAWGAEYLLILGSDDFLSPALVERYLVTLAERPLYAGVRQVYMYDVASERCLLADMRKQLKLQPITVAEANGRCTIVVLDGSQQISERRYTLRVWNEKSCIGAGRLVARSLFANNESPWDAELNRALDASFTRNVKPPVPYVIPTDDQAFVLDVKSGLNIWSFDKLVEWFPEGDCPNTSHLSLLPEWPLLRALRNA